MRRTAAMRRDLGNLRDGGGVLERWGRFAHGSILSIVGG